MNDLKILSWRSANFLLIAIVMIGMLTLPSSMTGHVPSWLSLSPSYVYGEEFLVRVNQLVFVPGDTVVIYGAGTPDDVLVARIFDATGRAVTIESIPVDDEGFFRKRVFEWPEPTANLAFGTYTIEINSSIGRLDIQNVQVTFAEGSTEDIDELAIPITHILIAKLDSPTEVSVNKPFRIFVQVTIDGALVKSDPATLLGSSHIHSGNITISLSDKFSELHEGIYYADVELEEEASYIVHAIAFYRGFLSHDSKVVSASAATIGSLQESLNDLNEKLTETRSTVDEARESIREDIESAKNSVDLIGDASGQINSLILPVLALISVILALQISLFARIRASYR